jgi:hypothetical protein
MLQLARRPRRRTERRGNCPAAHSRGYARPSRWSAPQRRRRRLCPCRNDTPAPNRRSRCRDLRRSSTGTAPDNRRPRAGRPPSLPAVIEQVFLVGDPPSGFFHCVVLISQFSLREKQECRRHGRLHTVRLRLNPRNRSTGNTATSASVAGLGEPFSRRGRSDCPPSTETA